MNIGISNSLSASLNAGLEKIGAGPYLRGFKIRVEWVTGPLTCEKGWRMYNAALGAAALAAYLSDPQDFLPGESLWNYGWDAVIHFHQATHIYPGCGEDARLVGILLNIERIAIIAIGQSLWPNLKASPQLNPVDLWINHPGNILHCLSVSTS